VEDACSRDFWLVESNVMAARIGDVNIKGERSFIVDDSEQKSAKGRSINY
jgi:hypothetical protein